MATVNYTLNKYSWTNIGTGPMFVENKGNKAAYWSLGGGGSAPVTATGDIDDAPQHLLGGEGSKRDISINFTQTVYARGDGTIITVTN